MNKSYRKNSPRKRHMKFKPENIYKYFSILPPTIPSSIYSYKTTDWSKNPILGLNDTTIEIAKKIYNMYDKYNFLYSLEKINLLPYCLTKFDILKIESKNSIQLSKLLISFSYSIKITKFSAYNEIVKDKKLVSTIKRLDLSYAHVSDVSALGKVHTLDLSGTNVSDVSALGNVHTLNLSQIFVSDLSALKNVVNINFYNTIIDDVFFHKFMLEDKKLEVIQLSDLSMISFLFMMLIIFPIRSSILPKLKLIICNGSYNDDIFKTLLETGKRLPPPIKLIIK